MTALCEASYTDDASQWMEIGASDRYWAAQNRNWSDVGKTRLEDTLVRTPRLLFIVRSWNTEDGLMCSCLSVYPHNFSQNWADGGVRVDAAPLGPSFHYCFVLLGVYVLQGFHHQWKNMEVGDIRCQLQVVMARPTWGLSSVRNIFAVFSPTGSLHTNHRLLHTSPIPARDASVTPFLIGGCGLIFLKYVGI